MQMILITQIAREAYATAPTLSPITNVVYCQCGNWGQSGRRGMHQHGELVHCGSTKMVLSKTRHIERSASRQGVSIGKLENGAMSLYARARGHEGFIQIGRAHV